LRPVESQLLSGLSHGERAVLLSRGGRRFTP
jgi:hypothetical protein